MSELGDGGVFGSHDDSWRNCLSCVGPWWDVGETNRGNSSTNIDVCRWMIDAKKNVSSTWQSNLEHDD